ncbi:c-type cytochrome [Faucicola atlantae]|uniref:c-type cytochrome n=1 Tax=Faucicola atlantae TaxID=34059 RepID=UPI0025B11A10|nr:c-type cytochrome [Moraxella atlantae]
MTNSKFLPLVALGLAGALSLSACSKHEEAEYRPTEEIAAEQGELARANNPPPAASEPATPAAQFGASATANTATASASSTASSDSKTVSASAGSATATGNVTASADHEAGEKLFSSVCKTCHEPGLMGAPKVSDKAEWQARLQKGKDTLYDHAIHGFQGKNGAMPPRGGSNASDDEVKAAVNYMLTKTGAANS